MLRLNHMILYTYSNILIAKIVGIPLGKLARLFLINNLESIKDLLKLYRLIYNNITKSRSDNIILAPVAGNWYTSRGDSLVLPNALFLLIKRITPTNPMDFTLFEHEVRIWFTKLNTEIRNIFIPIFIYDPIHIPHILIRYIPLILVNNCDFHYADMVTCFTDSTCFSYALAVDNLYISLGIWTSDEKLRKIMNLSHIKSDKLIKLSNPFFHPNPFTTGHGNEVRYLPTTYANNSKNNRLVIEFLSSYIVQISGVLKDFVYLWLPVPSSKLLTFIKHNFNGVNDVKLLVLSPINNFAEKGSLNDDRIWLSILKHITKAAIIRAIINGST